MIKALYVPADPRVPARVVEVDPDGSRELGRLVGGFIERVRRDQDCSAIVNDNGHAMQLPLNERATAWVREHSEAASRRRVKLAAVEDLIVGDVVFVGEDGSPSFVDVPDRVVEHMESQQPAAVILSLFTRLETIQAEQSGGRPSGRAGGMGF